MIQHTQQNTALVVGGRGKTGRRVAQRLRERGVPVRIGSHTGRPAFDWSDPATWAAVLQDVRSVYLTFYPDLAIPGAAAAVGAFSRRASDNGVARLVLLSGRGEPEAQRAEMAVRDSFNHATIVRSSWFNQNFSESFLLDAVLSGDLAVPVGLIGEPFIDAEDVADVAVAALTEHGHAGRLYEVTGPRLLTFADAAQEIADATGREFRYRPITPDQFAATLAELHTPPDVVQLLIELFTVTLDGRNAKITDGVRQALGRQPRDFADYARATAVTGMWDVDAAPAIAG